MIEEILEILDLLTESDKYKDIKKYFTTENTFFSLYKRQLYAYFRVSTGEQEFSRQIIELYKWLKKKNISICINNIYCDKYTGKRLNRKEYNCVRNILKENDYLIISDLNRLGRGFDNEGYENIKKEWYFYKYKGVNLLICEDAMNEFISAPLPNETVELSLSRLYMQDMIFINTLYKDCLKLVEVSRSTKNGMEKARAEGKIIGHPRSDKASKDNFIFTLELMINKEIGQMKATIKSGFPRDTFTRDIKKCYEKYNTKDYKTILNNIRMEHTWPL